MPAISLQSWRPGNILGAYLLAVSDAVERLCQRFAAVLHEYDMPDFGDISSEINGHRRYLADSA